MRRFALVLAGVLASGIGLPAAQWPRYPTPGVPRLPDGRVDLTAPAPRMPDGRPDISGLWLPSGPYVRGEGADGRPGEVPLQPWARALYQQRLDDHGRDDPSARCIQAGIPRANLIPYPFRIYNAPGRVVVIYEIFSMWREIFTDGRDLPHDPVRTWMGYSIGAWDGDSFVVRSTGFNGEAWLETTGLPTTDALRVTERFRRVDFGHMELQMTIDDPKAYTRPFVAIAPLTYVADSELMEYACNENNRYPALLPPR